MMRCPACSDDLGDAPARACGVCAIAIHATCWGRAGGCATFSCPEARGFRKAVVDYLDKQLTADLAVVGWTPTLLTALLVMLRGSSLWSAGSAAAGCAVVSLLLAPVVVVFRRRAVLRRERVTFRFLLELQSARQARGTSPLRRHAAAVARFEAWVSNPLLAAAILGSALQSLFSRDIGGLAVAILLSRVAVALYSGPSRRAVENPIRDFSGWSLEIERSLAVSNSDRERSLSTRNGELVRASE